MKQYCSLLLVFCCMSLWAQNPTRKIVLENITGAWCGLCPEGHHTSQQILNQYADVIPIGIHVGDIMETPTTQYMGDLYTGSGVNAFLLDRYRFPDLQFVPFTFEYEPLAAKVAERLAEPAKCSVQLTAVNFDTLSRQLSTTVTATFFADVSNYQDLRFNLLITEDSVQNTNSNYAQTNFFHNAPGYYYTGAGNPMYNYPHRHVLRAALGDAWGTEQSLNGLPNDIVAGSTFSHIYTYQLPQNWDIRQINIIGIVQNYDTTDYHHNEILNAADLTISDILATNQTADSLQATIINAAPKLQIQKVYPNPAQHQIIVQVQQPTNTPMHISLYDTTGKCLKTFYDAPLTKGQHQFQFMLPILPNGTYSLIVQTPNNTQQHQLYIAQ